MKTIKSICVNNKYEYLTLPSNDGCTLTHKYRTVPLIIGQEYEFELISFEFNHDIVSYRILDNKIQKHLMILYCDAPTQKQNFLNFFMDPKKYQRIKKLERLI